MDWKPFIATFTLLFIAELGDKTQLAVITQAAKFQRPWLVFAGAVLALVLVSAIGVALGQMCANCFPERLIKWTAGAAFIVMGILMVLGKI